MKVALTSDIHYGFSSNTANKIDKFCRKLAKDEPNVVIMAGDMASVAQHQYKRCLETFRQHFPNSVLLTVRGNHDLWDGLHRKDKLSTKRTLGMIYQEHEELYKRLNIYHLDDPLTIGDVTFFGFDGWYHSPDPGTNDENWIPRDHEGCPTMVYLSSNSFKQFDRVLDQYDEYKTKKNVLVSHFPSIAIKNDRHDFNASPSFLDEITCRFDVCCYGHSHKFMDQVEDGCRILNCGSDYNRPKALIFEI